MTIPLDTPSTQLKPKTMMTALASVIAVHGVVAVGLMNMPTLDIKPLAFTAPLEIALVKLQPAPKVIEPVAQSKPAQTNPHPSIVPKPLPHVDKVNKPTQPKTAPPPIAKVKPAAQQPPTVKTNQPVETLVTPSKPIPAHTTSPTDAAKPVEAVKTLKPNIMVSAEEQNTSLTQQANEAATLAAQEKLAQRGEQQRQAKIQQDAEDARQAEITKQQAAQQQADLQARQQQAHQQQARQQEALKQQLEQQKAQQLAEETAEQAKKLTQPSEPVRFGNGDAQWKSKPNLSFSGNLARIIEMENLSSMSVRLNVGTEGRVTSVVVTRSSGNAQVDSAVAQRLRAAKLKPFIRNGVAVAGTGNLTINLN